VEFSKDLLSQLYSVSGLVMLAFYIPQIDRVLRSETDLKELFLVTWGVWAAYMCDHWLCNLGGY
jgi:hypothetical protein